jgi:hypothetical protein
MTDPSVSHHAPIKGRAKRLVRQVGPWMVAIFLLGLAILPAILLPHELALVIYTAILALATVALVVVTILQKKQA